MTLGNRSQNHDGSGAMFDAIADRYDLLNRLISFGTDRGWRRQTATSLGDPQRILDLATGTGDLALEVAGRFPQATVTGLDPSGKMLTVARRKTEQRNLAARIQYVEGDAQALPFGDHSFDSISMAFGIRNVPDRAAALREMARVTVPGGRIAILELTEPTGALVGAFARLHVHWVVPKLGALLSGKGQYDYLSRSIAAFPPPQAFIELAARCGLQLIELKKFSFGACHLFVFTPSAQGHT